MPDLDDVRALTVQQPFAYAIAVGSKPVENRCWTTKWRGLLAIHAGATFAHTALRTTLHRHFARQQAERAGLSAYATEERYRRLLTKDAYVRGAFIAVADLVDVHADVGCCGRWAERADPVGLPVFHWRLEQVRQLEEPIRATGAQGLWRPLSEHLPRLFPEHVPPADPKGNP